MSFRSSTNPTRPARRTRSLYARAAALLSVAVSGGVAIAAALPTADLREAGSVGAVGMNPAAVLKGDLSMDEAIDRAQKRFRARVVRAERVEQDGRVVYVLRLLSDEDGRVFTVRVDARSGAMQ
jgi:uncharacterized membrane protein YkoI